MLEFMSVNIFSSGDVTTWCYLFRPEGNIFELPLPDIVASPRYEADAKRHKNCHVPSASAVMTCPWGLSIHLNLLGRF